MINTHYSRALHGASFYSTAMMIAEDLIEAFESTKKGVPLLCYTGLSGITSATMIAYFLNDNRFPVHHAYVRKVGEKSHGCPVESDNFTKHAKRIVPIFVDDFIDSGDTARYVMTSIESEFRGEIPATSFLHDVTDYGGMFTDCKIPHILTGSRCDSPNDYKIELFPELWYDLI